MVTHNMNNCIVERPRGEDSPAFFFAMSPSSKDWIVCLQKQLETRIDACFSNTNTHTQNSPLAPGCEMLQSTTNCFCSGKFNAGRVEFSQCDDRDVGSGHSNLLSNSILYNTVLRVRMRRISTIRAQVDSFLRFRILSGQDGRRTGTVRIKNSYSYTYT